MSKASALGSYYRGGKVPAQQAIERITARRGTKGGALLPIGIHQYALMRKPRPGQSGDAKLFDTLARYALVSGNPARIIEKRFFSGLSDLVHTAIPFSCTDDMLVDQHYQVGALKATPEVLAVLEAYPKFIGNPPKFTIRKGLVCTKLKDSDSANKILEALRETSGLNLRFLPSKGGKEFAERAGDHLRSRQVWAFHNQTSQEHQPKITRVTPAGSPTWAAIVVAERVVKDSGWGLT